MFDNLLEKLKIKKSKPKANKNLPQIKLLCLKFNQDMCKIKY